MRLILFLFYLSGSAVIYAQSLNCASDLIQSERMKDPALRMKSEKLERQLLNAAARSGARTVNGQTILTIPVVVHVLHTGEAVGTGHNIPDEQIINAIQSVNERLRGKYNNVDMGIEFALAVRDPNGNCTNGIDRVDMSGNPGYVQYGVGYAPAIGDSGFKWPTIWNSNLYCNIWTVSSITLPYFVSGYAFMADSHGTTEDGLVVVSGEFNPNSPTVAHELGHYLNLYHTFNGDGGNDHCPINNDCDIDGDKVCDTAPHMQVAPCEAAPNPCIPGGDNASYTYNIMSYSCSTWFSEGQRTRSQNSLRIIRSSLLEENGNQALIPPATPDVDFIATTPAVCVGNTVRLLDRSSCIPNTNVGVLGWSDITFTWTVTNLMGFTASSNEQNPTFTLTEIGAYDVTLTVTAAGGSNTETKKGLITVGEAPVPSCIPRNVAPEVCDDIDFGFGIYDLYLNTIRHHSGSTCEDIQMGRTDANGYGDFACTEATTLEADTEYEIGVVRGGGEIERVYIYIDFDNNGITEEDLVTWNDAVPGGAELTMLPVFRTPLLPPLHQLLRMRVITDETYNGILTGACGETTYGQIHDFGVIFTPKIPIARDDSSTTDEDQPVTIDVVANDFARYLAIDKRTIDLDEVETFFQYQKITSEGIWTARSNGTITFQPAPNFNGVASTTYTVSDVTFFGQSLPATVTVVVNPVNDAPAALDDEATTPEDVDVTIDVAANDSDIENKLDVASIDLDSSISGVQKSRETSAGVWVANDSGKVSYSPGLDFNGSASIHYTINDDELTSNVAKITVMVTPVDDPVVIPPIIVPPVVVPPVIEPPIADPPKVFFISNGFTPNGDGVNDLFVIEGADPYAVSLWIFNRWGNEVFTDANYRNDWAGSSVPDGTYFYVVEVLKNDKERYNGFIEIRR